MAHRSRSKNDQSDWKELWSGRTDTDARLPSIIEKEVRERLLLLDGGESLLDFGCGTGEILIHIAPHYPRVIGADISLSMLEQARLKFQQGACQDIRLLCADEQSLWTKIDESFDRITSTQVVQHMDPEQVDHFITQAADHLNTGGRIVLFDMVHPHYLTFHKLGLLFPEYRPAHLS